MILEKAGVHENHETIRQSHPLTYVLGFINRMKCFKFFRVFDVFFCELSPSGAMPANPI